MGWASHPAPEAQQMEEGIHAEPDSGSSCGSSLPGFAVAIVIFYRRDFKPPHRAQKYHAYRDISQFGYQEL